MARRSLSEYASISMVLLGVLTILFVEISLGIIICVVGLVMYLVYRRVTASVRRGAGGPSTDGGPSAT